MSAIGLAKLSSKLWYRSNKFAFQCLTSDCHNWISEAVQGAWISVNAVVANLNQAHGLEMSDDVPIHVEIQHQVLWTRP